MLTTQEAATNLGVTIRRIRALIQAGRLKAVKHGRDWDIDPADLEAVRERQVGRPVGWRKQKVADENG